MHAESFPDYLRLAHGIPRAEEYRTVDCAQADAFSLLVDGKERCTPHPTKYAPEQAPEKSTR